MSFFQMYFMVFIKIIMVMLLWSIILIIYMFKTRLVPTELHLIWTINYDP